MKLTNGYKAGETLLQVGVRRSIACGYAIEVNMDIANPKVEATLARSRLRYQDKVQV
jgi:hypothetical protein